MLRPFLFVHRPLRSALTCFFSTCFLSLGLCACLSFNCMAYGEEPSEAFSTLMEKAQQDDAVAQRDLAKLYIYGDGVAKDEKKAFYWLQRSAGLGDATAQYDLGDLYHMGIDGIQDDQKSIYWFKKAANQGNEDAQYNLEAMYHNGYGVPRDDNEAFYWEQKVIEQEMAKQHPTQLLPQIPEPINPS